MAAEHITSPLVDLLQQYKLLQQEFEYEKETFYQQTQRAGIPKRVRQGVCWYPVTAHKSYYNSLNQLVIEIKRDENDDTDHNFEYGRPVCFFRIDETGNPRYFNFAATISYVHEHTMLVVLPNSNSLLDIQGARELGVQLYFDGTSYKTMFSALTESWKPRTIVWHTCEKYFWATYPRYNGTFNRFASRGSTARRKKRLTKY